MENNKKILIRFFFLLFVSVFFHPPVSSRDSMPTLRGRARGRVLGERPNRGALSGPRPVPSSVTRHRPRCIAWRLQGRVAHKRTHTPKTAAHTRSNRRAETRHAWGGGGGALGKRGLPASPPRAPLYSLAASRSFFRPQCPCALCYSHSHALGERSRPVQATEKSISSRALRSPSARAVLPVKNRKKVRLNFSNCKASRTRDPSTL